MQPRDTSIAMAVGAVVVLINAEDVEAEADEGIMAIQIHMVIMREDLEVPAITRISHNHISNANHINHNLSKDMAGIIQVLDHHRIMQDKRTILLPEEAHPVEVDLPIPSMALTTLEVVDMLQIVEGLPVGTTEDTVAMVVANLLAGEEAGMAGTGASLPIAMVDTVAVARTTTIPVVEAAVADTDNLLVDIS